MFRKNSLLVVSSLLCLGFAGQAALANTNTVVITIRQATEANSNARPVQAVNRSVVQSAARTSSSVQSTRTDSRSNVQPASAQTNAQTNNIQEFKLQPRVNLWGFTGDDTFTEGQILVPVYGDQSKALYVAVENYYSNDDDDRWMMAAGLGYRQIVSDRIWGAYALIDYLHTSENVFPVINPGVEMLGNAWDVSVNGYIPTSNRKKKGKEGWAGDDFGIYNYGRPTGHDFYDHRMQQYEEIGRGFDFQVARVIPRFEDAKLHLGTYYFDTPDGGSVKGVSSKLTYNLNKYSSLELKNTYDNVKHNQFLVGIRFVLGEYSKEEKKLYGMATRLLDPIEHALSSGGLAMVTKLVDKGEQKEHDNIWYFRHSPNGDKQEQEGSGTYEDPFIGFTSSNYGAIDPHIGIIDEDPLMYFAPGTYGFHDFHSREMDDRFNLPNGWGMYGRTDDYKAPATGDQRAVFYGGLDIDYSSGDGHKATTLDSINVKSFSDTIDTTGDYAALYVNNADNLILKNDKFESSGYGIWAENSTLNFNGGDNYVIGYEQGEIGSAVTFSYGIRAQFSTINFNSGNNVISSSDGVNTTSTGYGIAAKNSVINFNGGTNTVTGASAVDVNNVDNDSYGIRSENSTINFNGGTNTINASSVNTLDDYNFSIVAWGISAENSAINFNGGVNSINSTVQGENVTELPISAYGLSLYDTVVNFNGGINTISSAYHGSDEASVYGIYNSEKGDNNSSVNFKGGINTINANGGSKAYGIYSDGDNSSTLTVNFANSSDNKVTISASANDEQYGIYVKGANSYIQRNGTNLSDGTTLAEMQQYINFVGAGAGAAVDWDNHFILDWPQ